MRSAGCIINDLWDKDFDAQVERTKNRPLASGQMQVREAIIILALLLTIALAILLQLRMEVFWFAVASLPLVVLYPLMKRITWWPQAFLGLTFNFGALMGWVAVTGTLELSAILLYLCGIFWTLGYDTIYAFQDIEDDAKIGVKSTALRFKERPKQAISLFFTLSYLAFFAAILTSTSNGLTLLASLFFLGLLIAQIISFNQLDRGNCQRQFKQHSLIGLSNLIILLLNFLH